MDDSASNTHVHTLSPLDSLLDLWCVICFFFLSFFSFPPFFQLSFAWKKPSTACLSSFITSRSSHSISHVCGLNEKQLVCGVSLRACLYIRVRPCDEMATTLIVWHRAAAAFCQKSSSDSPTGMMAHLTNASPQNGPTMPIQPTEERANGGVQGGRGSDRIRLMLVQFR